MRKLGCLVLVVVFCYIAYSTNPTEKEHIENAYSVLKEHGIDNYGINSDYLTIGQGLLGKEQMDVFLENFVHRRNYLLFSLTEVDINGNKEIIAIGLFGKLWNIGDIVGLAQGAKSWVDEQINGM